MTTTNPSRGEARGRGIRQATAGGLAALLLSPLLLALGCAHDPAPLQLVTAEEAALPAAPQVRSRMDSQNGPIIELLNPETEGTYDGPFPVSVRFLEGPRGHAVDTASLKVFYKKMWDIDITSRLSDYFSENGISAPAVDLPPGRHTVRVYIEDVEQNATSRTFSVTVEEDD